MHRLPACRSALVLAVLVASNAVGQSDPATPPVSAPAAPPAVRERDAKETATPARASRSTSIVGTAAPELAIDAWVKGGPIASFEPGRIYVVEFWATWCGPCLASMGHLTHLAREFGSPATEGGPPRVTIVGVTSRDDRGNTREAVEALVADRGAGIDYLIAWDQGRTTWSRWMGADGRSGIPAAFVVGPTGTVEFSGHPSLLDLVLPPLVEGTWDRTKGAAEIAEAQQAQQEADRVGRTDPKAGLELFKAFEARWPRYATQFLMSRADLERGAGLGDQAVATVRSAIAKAEQVLDGPSLQRIAARALSRAQDPAWLALARDAIASANTASGGRNATFLRLESKILERGGDLQGALASLRKALEHSDATTKPRLESELAALEAKIAGNGAAEPPAGRTPSEPPSDAPAGR
jgi:thiol-disulfide isomerase/thioredoxin